MIKFLRTLFLLIGVTVLGTLVFEYFFREAEETYLTRPGALVSTWKDDVPVTVHLDCKGPKRSHRPIILLEAGALGWSSSWWRVQQLLSQDHRVCTWDRPGMGWSPAPLLPLSVKDYAPLLHQILQEQGEKGPYLLAGHSMGSLILWDFAQQYPNDVQAFLMIDPAHPQQFDRLPTPLLKETHEQLNLLKWGPTMADLGLLRWFDPPILSIQSLPFPWQQSVYHFANNPQHLTQARNEVMQWRQAWPDRLTFERQFSWPVWVLSVEHRTPVAEWTSSWRDLHTELSHLSKQGKLMIAPNVDHQGILFTEEGAQFVLSQIETLEQESRPKRHMAQR